MLIHIIEALLFAAGKGISLQEMVDYFGEEYTKQEIETALSSIKKEYSGKKGIILIEFNNKYQFQSNEIYGEKLVDILQPIKEKALSKTLLQTLSIIAYRQPITRAEIEEVRNGVSCDYSVSVLLKIGLIDVIGRKMESLGRPALFATTDEFLKKFGMKSLEELPDYEKLMVEVRNSDKYNKDSGNLYRMDNENVSEEELDYDDINEDIPDYLKGEDIVIVE
ncbi:MAG: SMC-Scp complex subunit ScpB [Clostridia bacterium]